MAIITQMYAGVSIGAGAAGGTVTIIVGVGAAGGVGRMNVGVGAAGGVGRMNVGVGAAGGVGRITVGVICGGTVTGGAGSAIVVKTWVVQAPTPAPVVARTLQ
jgi:hypothetical protein